MNKQRYNKEPKSGGNRNATNDAKRDNRRNDRVKHNTDRDATLVDAQKAINDVSWYAYDDSILRATANLPFSAPLGLDIHTPLTVSDISPLPGLMVARFQAVPGMTGETAGPAAGSPVNVAAQSLYSFVRHANSGSKNYEAADLMMYLLAMDSMYTMYADARRIYGIAHAVSKSNRYFPKGVINALGWDANDVMTNLAKLRAAINNMAYMLGAFAVPGNMSFMTRHIWMCSHIWVDNPGRKAQVYAFSPDTLWFWSGTTDEAGTELRQMNYPLGPEGTRMTVDNFVFVYQQLLGYLQRDEDIGIISGDILKAFGEDKCVHLATISEDFVLVTEFTPEIVLQFNNAVVCGRLSGSIHQDSGVILVPNKVEQISNSIYDYAYARGGLLNMPMDVPTPADVMEATRLANIIMPRDSDAITYDTLTTCGSEIISYIMIYKSYADVNNMVGYLWNQAPGIMANSAGKVTDGAWANYAQTLVNSAQVFYFDYGPIIYSNTAMRRTDDETGLRYTATKIDPVFESHNYTAYNEDFLKQCNYTALLTQLMSPGMGGFNPAKMLF